MEQMKRFSFLAQHCDALIVVRSWGSTREEAKSHLNLNQSTRLVEDSEVIENFIKKEKAEIESFPHNDNLIGEYIEDLNCLEESLKNKKSVSKKEKLSALLSEALDKRASITINFSQFHKDWTPVTEEEAHKVISQFSEALGNKNINRNVGGAGTEVFLISQDDFYITCSFFPEKEDAKLRRIEQLKRQLAELESKGVRA